ncbi:MAG: 4Fe-4S dicluster domain-containing protein [Chloroflexota bacterium]
MADLPPIDPATGRRPGAVGFLTDASLCIGCKACEVACKQWNDLPADGPFELTGRGYDNTGDLGATTWRHVAFVERDDGAGGPVTAWLMLSDVCKHCIHAGCMEACPTGAIIRTEFDTVFIQPDVCNGCGYCVPACPFGVPQIGHDDGLSRKCTFCYDRLRAGDEPACAKSCPTDSIRFGPADDMLRLGRERVDTLRARGVDAALYGDGELGGSGGIAGLNSVFVITDRPETFHLPAAPALPSRNLRPALAGAAATAALLLLAVAGAARREP